MLKINLNFLPLRLYSRTSRKVSEEAQEKMVKVAIIGLPNSGKSTLINTILETKVCPTSDKVHTTTNFAQAITNRHNSQIIVFDTPGLVSKQEMKKHKLDEKFISSCRHSIQHADLIGVLHDVSNPWTRDHLNTIILDLLKEFKKVPSFLILNKIDKLKSKRALLDSVKALTCNNLSLDIKVRVKPPPAEPVKVDKNKEWEKPEEVGWPHFNAVFMVSSLNGDGVDKVVEYVESCSVAKPWQFRNNEITDKSPPVLIEEFVRARLLDYLPQEIPYQLTTELEYFSDENNKIYASVNVYCPNQRVERLVCGIGDGKLRQITDRVTSDLIQSFKVPVTLTVCTSVKKPIDN